LEHQAEQDESKMTGEARRWVEQECRQDKMVGRSKKAVRVMITQHQGKNSRCKDHRCCECCNWGDTCMVVVGRDHLSGCVLEQGSGLGNTLAVVAGSPLSDLVLHFSCDFGSTLAVVHRCLPDRHVLNCGPGLCSTLEVACSPLAEHGYAHVHNLGGGSSTIGVGQGHVLHYQIHNGRVASKREGQGHTLHSDLACCMWGGMDPYDSHLCIGGGDHG